MVEEVKSLIKDAGAGRISLILFLLGQALGLTIYGTRLDGKVTQLGTDVGNLFGFKSSIDYLLPRWAIVEDRQNELIKKQAELLKEVQELRKEVLELRTHK